ncbi:MAG TPA: MarR family transcriptional regulator [Acidimicrobiia bacterium]|nr:MarR family transcriptional regulator [Acidimicrobiia bacterium]
MCAEVLTEGVIDRLEGALTGLVRQLQAPRLQQRVAAGAGAGLERAAYVALRRIHDQGAVRLSELAQQLDLDASTVSRQVRHLEAAGLVARRDDPGDGRACVVGLTDAGGRALAALAGARRRFVAEVVAGWSDEDRAVLAGLLERLAADVAVSLSVPPRPGSSWKESRP